MDRNGVFQAGQEILLEVANCLETKEKIPLTQCGRAFATDRCNRADFT